MKNLNIIILGLLAIFLVSCGGSKSEDGSTLIHGKYVVEANLEDVVFHLEKTVKIKKYFLNIVFRDSLGNDSTLLKVVDTLSKITDMDSVVLGGIVFRPVNGSLINTVIIDSTLHKVVPTYADELAAKNLGWKYVGTTGKLVIRNQDPNDAYKQLLLTSFVDYRDKQDSLGIQSQNTIYFDFELKKGTTVVQILNYDFVGVHFGNYNYGKFDDAKIATSYFDIFKELHILEKNSYKKNFTIDAEQVVQLIFDFQSTDSQGDLISFRKGFISNPNIGISPMLPL